MTRSAYYEEMRELARDVRNEYRLATARVTLTDMRRIYRDQGIKIDLWPPKDCMKKLKRLRGAYFCDAECGPSVLVDRNLPEEPRIFTLGHELKHHLRDRTGGAVHCSAGNADTMVEIGAEVFSGELIFPDDLFHDEMRRLGVRTGACAPENLVYLKRDSATTLSYAGLAKRAEFLGYARQGAMAGVQFRNLEERLLGVPAYRARRSAYRS